MLGIITNGFRRFKQGNLGFIRYEYTFKDTNKSGFSYRCKYKTICGLTINIDKDNLNNIINNSGEIIKYVVSSKKYTNHTCKNNLKTNIESNLNIIKEEKGYSAKQIEETAKILINQNLELKPLWHKINLSKNNINMPLKKIRNILYSLREAKYPDELYIVNDISKITIDLGKEEKLKNLPFCHIRKAIINYRKNRMETFLVFTTIWQLKMLTKTTYLFIDATFKTAPRGFYQTLNIMGFIEDVKKPILLIFVPMTHKSYESYNNIFVSIKTLIESLNISLKYDKLIIIADYEKALRNAVLNNFPDIKMEGCYFHYVKNLWSYAKKHSLCKKNILNKTQLIIFCFKIYPYILEEEKKEFLSKIKNHFENVNQKFKNFFDYFIKNWQNNNLLNFHYFSQEKYNFRTNNYLERYHLLLNEIIENYHPKLPFFLDKMKNIIKNYYNDYIIDLTNAQDVNIYQYDITKDMVDFIVKFQQKYKKKINSDDIIQFQNSEIIELSKSVYKFLDIVFGIENNKDSENLLLQNYNDLSDEQKLIMLNDISFIKMKRNNNNIKVEDSINKQNNDNSDNNSFDEDSSKEDEDETDKNENNQNIFQISSGIYNEKINFKKKRKYCEITNKDCELISNY